MDNIKRLLLELLNFDTQNDDDLLNGNTLELLQHVKKRLEKVPEAKVKLIEYELKNGLGNRGILIAYLDDKLPKIVLQGHTDTVPFGNFQGNPLGEVKGNKIYGRGAVDMKGPLAAMITAFERLSLVKEKKYSPVLVLTSDEEAKNFAGIKKFLEVNEIPIDFAICGEPTDFKIYNRFKGAAYLIIDVIGKSAHGSRPYQGINAIYGANEIVRLLEDFSKHVASIINKNFETENEHTMQSTLNVGKIVGGDKVNTVPERCSIEFEMRLVQPFEIYDKELKEKVFDKINKSVSFEIKKIFSHDPAEIKADNKYIKELELELEKYGKKPELSVMTGFSEANFTNLAGISTVVFGPGGDCSHMADENVSLKDLKDYETILVSFFE